MEYYLILKDNDYIHDMLSTDDAVVSNIIIIEDSDKPLLTHYNSPNIAFATSNKICIGVRNRDTTLKDNLIHSLSQLEYDLNDTSMFKRITAKEYYSLLD